jgi:hypothetical protein
MIKYYLYVIKDHLKKKMISSVDARLGEEASEEFFPSAYSRASSSRAPSQVLPLAPPGILGRGCQRSGSPLRATDALVAVKEVIPARERRS